MGAEMGRTWPKPSFFGHFSTPSTCVDAQALRLKGLAAEARAKLKEFEAPSRRLETSLDVEVLSPFRALNMS